MSHRRRNRCFAFFTSLTAVVALSVAFAAQASPGGEALQADSSTAPWAKRLSTLADDYSDPAGMVVFDLIGGGQRYLATSIGNQPFSFYSAGDDVDDNIQLAGCIIDTQGGASDCDPAYGEPLILALESLRDDPDFDPNGGVSSDCEEGPNGSFFCEVNWFTTAQACYYIDSDGHSWQVNCN